MTATVDCEHCLEEKRKASLDLLLFGTGCCVEARTAPDGEHQHARHIPLRDIKLVLDVDGGELA